MSFLADKPLPVRAAIFALLALVAVACSASTESEVETSGAAAASGVAPVIVTVEPVEAATVEDPEALPTALFGDSTSRTDAAASDLTFSTEEAGAGSDETGETEQTVAETAEQTAESTAEPSAAPESSATPLPEATATPVPAPTATPVPEPTVAPAPASFTVGLPSVTVVDLGSGQDVNLAALSPPGPALLWFWAPH